MGALEAGCPVCEGTCRASRQVPLFHACPIRILVELFVDPVQALTLSRRRRWRAIKPRFWYEREVIRLFRRFCAGGAVVDGGSRSGDFLYRLGAYLGAGCASREVRSRTWLDRPQLANAIRVVLICHWPGGGVLRRGAENESAECRVPEARHADVNAG